MSIKLLAPPAHGRTNKILFAAELAAVQVELVETTLEIVKSKEFTKKNPLGKVPVLETADGPLFESNAILRHIARLSKGANLYGSNPYEQGLVDQWLDVSTGELEINALAQVLQVLGYVPTDEKAYQAAFAQTQEVLTVINQQLSKGQFIVGNSITIADVALASVTNLLFTYVYGEKLRESFPNVLKWQNHLTSLPQWLKHFGKPRYCKAAFTVVKAKAEKTEKAPAAKKEVEKKDQPKKEQPAKKEQPVKQEVAAKPVQEEEEAEPKKKQNPLDLLPKSTFDIDNFKRQFFIDKDIKKSITDLLNNFDNEGWSLWEITYNKAPGEGKQILFTRNLFKGFLQRFDPNFRKYSFAIHGMYGDEPNLELKGAWLWRGTALPQEILDHPQYDVHTFKKIDLNNDQQKQLWTDYWVNQTEDESKVDGLTLRECIYFR